MNYSIYFNSPLVKHNPPTLILAAARFGYIRLRMSEKPVISRTSLTEGWTFAT